MPLIRTVFKFLRRSEKKNGHNIVAFDSATSALTVALRASAIRRPEISTAEAIIPSYCCPDVVSAVLLAGLRPIFIDVQKDALWASDDDILRHATRSTVAVVDIFPFGIRPPRARDSLAKLMNRSIACIADRAQSHAEVASPNGYCMSVHSFGRGKPSSLGYGGYLAFTNEVSSAIDQATSETGPELSSLRCVLKTTVRYLTFRIATTPFLFARLKGIPALGIGKTQLKKKCSPIRVPRWLRDVMITEAMTPSVRQGDAQLVYERAEWRSEYARPLAPTEDTRPLKLWRFPILAYDRKTRDALVHALNIRGLGATILYGSSVRKFLEKSYILEDFTYSDDPNADDVADRLITLPVHQGVSADTARLILQIVNSIDLPATGISDDKI